MFGMDIDDEKYVATVLREAEKDGKKELGEKDLETQRLIWSVPADGFTDELLKKAGPWSQNMMVVKLNSGGVLLYCPVKLHQDMVDFIATLGPVEWIVLGSSAHNNYPPGVIARYPRARVVGASLSEDKLAAVNALPRKRLDYNVLRPNDVVKVNE